RHGLRSLDPHGGRDAILELHRMAMLTITSGGGLGTVVDVLDEVLLGRDNASLGIGDTTVSRRHAVIRPIDDRLEVEDLGSVNGTRVNGIRIRAVTRLKDGDVIEIGGTALTVSIEPAQDAVTVAGEQLVAATAVTPHLAAPAVPQAELAPLPSPPPAPPLLWPALGRGGIASRN